MRFLPSSRASPVQYWSSIRQVWNFNQRSAHCRAKTGQADAAQLMQNTSQVRIMPMLETDEMSEPNLPPEIVRRLQVEELWARRLVLADLMNAERLKLYY